MSTTNPPALWDFSLPAERSSPWGGYRVLDAATRCFVEADPADVAMVRDYPFWIDKGTRQDGTRLTLTTARAEVAVGEPVRVAHIVEECGSDRTLFGVGPKPIRDEYVDGVLVTAATPNPDDYPWLPKDYDGEATPSPGIDDNFAVTEYCFDEPGSHRIEWRPGRFRSNVLVVTVLPAPTLRGCA